MNESVRRLALSFLPAAIVLLVLLFFLYRPGLMGEFFFDDIPNIVLNPSIQVASFDWAELSQSWRSGSAGPSGRPVSMLTFSINHYFSGFDPFAFKVTNLGIHAANALLVFLLALRLLAAARLALTARILSLTAGIVAAVWLLHPIQMMPVLHVVQRMTILSALFLLGAMLLHVQARERDTGTGWWKLGLAWTILWPMSYLSKETGALFPVFVLAYELIIRRGARGSLDGLGRVLAGSAMAVTTGVALYAVTAPGQWLWAGYDMRSFTLAQRLMTEGRVLWGYLGMIFLPQLEAFGLYHDDIGISHGLMDPRTTLPALVGLVCLAGLAWGTRRRAPLVAFGIAWFLIGHCLESTFLPLELAYEHRNYVPIFGLLLPAALGLALLVQRTGPYRALGIGLSIVAIGYPAFVTAMRANSFRDELRRTQIEAQLHPLSARAQYDAGLALMRATIPISPGSPGYQFSRRHYERAGELDSAFKQNWLGLIQLNCLSGAKPEPGWVEELSHRLRETPFAPGDRTVLFSLKEMAIAGELCLDRPDVERVFAAALANPTASTPARAMLHSWQADYLTLVARDLPAAQAELDRLLAIVPGDPSNQLKRAQLAYLQGQAGEARSMLNNLRGALLSKKERTTLREIDACLDDRDGSVTCVRQ